MTGNSTLEGRTALVTGAAGGIGQAVARRLRDAGAAVVATDLDPPDLGAAALCLAHDVSRAEDWQRVLASAEAAFGPVSVLINNAGTIQWNVPIEALSENDFRRVLDVNTVGAWLGMKTVLPSMRAAGSGSVVNFSSTAGLIGYWGISGYVASKWAVRGLTKAAAIEFGTYGIRVNSVHPGQVRTAMTAGMPEPHQPLARSADPGEVAELVLFLASDAASYCTGAEFVVDGGHTSGMVVGPE